MRTFRFTFTTVDEEVRHMYVSARTPQAAQAWMHEHLTAGRIILSMEEV